MKKILKAVLVFLVAFLVVGCQQANQNGSTQEGKNDSGSVETAENEKEATGQDDPLRIALVVGEEGDYSFNDAAISGFRKVKEDYGDAVYLRQFEYQDRIENAFLEAAENDFDVIVGSTDLEELVIKFAEQYPDTKFWLYDNEMDYSQGNLENVMSIHYNANEAAYIGGYLAAATSDTGIIGFLGGRDMVEVRDFYVGYVEGARAADPDIKVVSAEVGNFEDHAKGKELGAELFDQGASMVFNVAAGAGIGLIEAAVEKDGQVLGVDLDQAAIFAARGQSLYAERIPTSVMKNIGESLNLAVESELAGEIDYGQVQSVGLAEDGVGLADNAYFYEAYSGELIKKASDLKKQIINGEIEVGSAFDMTDEEYQKFKNSAAE